jgi:hypothetical protein
LRGGGGERGVFDEGAAGNGGGFHGRVMEKRAGEVAVEMAVEKLLGGREGGNCSRSLYFCAHERSEGRF